MKNLIPQKLKNIYHLANAAAANIWYGFPTKKLKVIGVTGTNGKTTAIQLISKVLEDAGNIVGASSTINFKIGKQQWVNKTKFTTLSSWKVQEFAKKVVDAECEYLVLEVSSHSLDQNRLWGIDFDVAVITNVTREHLDYHKTMDEYRAAKIKLFKRLRDKGVAIVNMDMKNPEGFFSAAVNSKKIGYSAKNQDNDGDFEIIQATKIELNQGSSIFIVKDVEFKLHLPGKFNVENALAAVCVGVSQDINMESIAKSIARVKKVAGRMDYVENKRGLEVIIDYALTPDSMEKLGKYIKQTNSESKLIWVFGSCGERDRGKRPVMGDIVSRYADYAIVTNEDPYGEDPNRIINEVFRGVLHGGKKENIDAWKIFDRRDAIKKALELAQTGDVVLVTGKGAEETMAIGKNRVSWNDKKVIREILGELES